MNSYVMLAFLLFGILSVIITYSLSKVRGESSVLFWYFLYGYNCSFSALISLVKYTADLYDKLPAITYWLMGSFSSSSYNNIKIAVFPIITGIMILYFLRWRINILSLGDEEVKALGMNPVYIRGFIIVAVTMISATCVTLTGIIGWVGLLIPHMSYVYRSW